MKNVITLALAWVLMSFSCVAQAKLSVFACEPEWASLAAEIGGDRVKTFSATNANQDPHHIRARPSLIARARAADLVFCSGAGLEVGWLPLVLQRASASVQPGKIGNLMASDYTPMLEKPKRVDRSMGDVHPEGNPHVHLNPQNVLKVAAELTRRYRALDPQNAQFYEARFKNFNQRWQQAMSRWKASADELSNQRVVVHHKGFSYLLDWLNINQVGALEPLPGLPPTPSHLQRLLSNLKAKPAAAILRTPYEPASASQWLSKRTGIPAVALPYTVGGDAQSGDLFELYDRSIALLKGAMSESR